MSSFKFVAVLVLLHNLVVEAPDPLPRRDPIKRLNPDTSFHPPPPPKHTKLEETFVNKFRKWDIGKSGKMDGDLVAPFLGHGGTYEAVQPLASELNTIESDHAPHYSILDYLDLEKVDAKQLPGNIKSAVETRKLLQDELAKTDYPKNEERLKSLKKTKDVLSAELNKPIRVNKWPDKGLQKRFTSNNEEISQLEAKNKAMKDNPSMELKIAQNQDKINKLMKTNSELRLEAEKSFKTPEKQAKLQEMELEYSKLEKVNKGLGKALEDHNANIKKAMGVLSIPYDKHRMFPSTGNVLDEIRNLKNADAGTAKFMMEDYDKAWKANMNEGITKKYFKNADNFAKKTPDGNFVFGPDGKKIYDYQKLWEANFDGIMDGANEDKLVSKSKGKPKSKKGKKAPVQTPEQFKSSFMKRLHGTYANKFITTTIYYIKTPEKGYGRLVNLYINEYKTYLKGDFDSYKVGLQKLLETNKDFGWLNAKDIEKLKNDYKLDVDTDMDSSDKARAKANQWNEVEELIKIKGENSKNPLTGKSGSAVNIDADMAPPGVCTSGRKRRKRSTAARGCIFFSKKSLNTDMDGDQRKAIRDLDVDGHPKVKPKPVIDLNVDDQKVKANVDPEVAKKKPSIQSSVDAGDFDDGFPRPKISLPSDSDTVSIDSKRLATYLTQMDDGDVTSARLKESVVEHASRNSEKLSGTPEEIARTKALLKQANLESHSQQNALASKSLRNSGDIPPKALSKYQKVKISASKFAAKAGKFTSTSGKVSGSYGKIMLAKGVVTALRHGDYESLALMGGRIGLEFGLQAVTKLGQHIAKKATTKFMTKLGSQFLGKMAGPVGALADIGMNVYSISKSVKRLNDPNASKFDQNDAIADIVADSIDIAVTASAAVLSLVFPPLAPLFAAVAFIVNVLTTLIVAFYKAANHVDRLNDQIPLLDYERTNEYWRYVGGRDTSGYITELIDTKKANNIAVNLTVQFLISNPDYIGRIFPSKTMHDPEAQCALQEKRCGKLFHFIPLPCKDWSHLSDCEGAGGYCKGVYSQWKCQSDSGTGLVVPLGWHTDKEYRCRCGSDPPPVWGYEVLDNEVDFRNRQDVYLQRAAPDFAVPSGFSYQCKPSSLDNEGDRVSNRYTNWAYLCKGAIGVRRSGSGGKFMLYDLGTGTDTIRLDSSETVDNLFVVKDGRKDFEENAGDDTFVLDGPCESISGRFDGKSYRVEGNSLVLGEKCSVGEPITVDLVSHGLTFGSGGSGTRHVLFHFIPIFLGVKIWNIQRVIGRKNGVEIIKADCETKLVVGGGTRYSSEMDEVYLPSCSDTDLTLSIEGNTVLYANSFTRGKVFTVLKGKPEFEAYVPGKFNGTLLFKFEDVGGLTSASVASDGKGIILGFGRGQIAKFEFDGGQPSTSSTCGGRTQEGNQISILFNENSEFSRQLSYDLEQRRVQCLYRLEKGPGEGVTIHGYHILDNIFHLKSGRWNGVYGGSLTNQFNLVSSEFSGLVDGGVGGQSTLLISNELRDVSNLEVNLYSGFLRGGRIGSIQIRNIESVVGRDSFSEFVTTGCNTKSLDLGGTAADRVVISSSSCPRKNEVTITVKGKVSISNQKADAKVTVQGGYEKNRETTCSPRVTSSPPLELRLEGERMTVLLNFPISKLQYATKTLISVNGGHQVFINGLFPNFYFEEGHDMKSMLVVEGGKLLAFHEVSNPGAGGFSQNLRKGATMVPNMFKLVGGPNWKVIGGNLDDIFSLAEQSFQGEIDGGGGGKDSLVIGDHIHGVVSIGENRAVMIGGRKSLTFQNIHEVHGRVGQPEKISLSCDIQFVGMNGGRDLQNSDEITIPNLACDRRTTIVAMGFTNLVSHADKGKVDVYVQQNSNSHLKFKADVKVTNETVFNFPIQYSTHKLLAYELNIYDDDQDGKVVRYRLKMSENDNFVELRQTLQVEGEMRNVNVMFVDEDFGSIGTVLVNLEQNELVILHALEAEGAGTGSELKTRRGATGAKNTFRLQSGKWEAYGGTFDDSFILKDAAFQGKIHGLGGVNSLILSEEIEASQINVNLSEKTLRMGTSSDVIQVHSVQSVLGRKLKQEKVQCSCETKLVMLEGGESGDAPDLIQVSEAICQSKMSFVIGEFTRIENSATSGNFTYHVRTDKHFDINYDPTDLTNHAFKFEMELQQIKNISMGTGDGGLGLQINFESGHSKIFPLNFQNIPTFQIGQGPELLAELILEEDHSPLSSIVANNPFSGTVQGIHGAENGIIIQTSHSLQSIIGGDEDDNIFLDQVESVLLISGRGGTNRLQFSDQLHKDQQMEVDFPKENIKFIGDVDATSSTFVTVMKGIKLFSGRKMGFERVILGCDTASVKFADEIIIRENCQYNVRMEIGEGANTRVIFDLRERRQIRQQNVEIIEEDEEEEEENEVDVDDEVTTENPLPDTDEEVEPFEDQVKDDESLELLEPSTFYYHFATIQTFDIEVDHFSRLRQTRHIFYLNFTLSDLASIRFSIDDSRLVYSPFSQNELEYSHHVGELEETAMYYSQPEFMTGEGFLLRISRYGEIIAVIANPEEYLELDFVQQDLVPRLAMYSSQLGISFMLETGSDFIDCGSQAEGGVLTNRENVTSHLVGFNGTTYEILDLVHVLDLTDVIFKIREMSKHKYVPQVRQVGKDLEIEMTNFTELFPGKVTLVNGTSYYGNVLIMLNSIAMEILPNQLQTLSLSSTTEEDLDEERVKRSITMEEEDSTWVIKPKPISIPEGHVYLLAADDLEDDVEIRKEVTGGVGDDGEANSTFEYSKDQTDLVITSMKPEELETGKVTSFIIFDYFSPSQEQLEEEPDQNDTLKEDPQFFGGLEIVKNLHIRLGSEQVKVTSNEPILSEETGEELEVQYYEDILDREEAKMLEEFPDIPRKFKVSLWQKFRRSEDCTTVIRATHLSFTVLVGVVIWMFCRRKPTKGKYSVEGMMTQMQPNKKCKGVPPSSLDEKELLWLGEQFSSESCVDYDEPSLIITGMKLLVTEDEL